MSLHKLEISFLKKKKFRSKQLLEYQQILNYPGLSSMAWKWMLKLQLLQPHCRKKMGRQEKGLVRAYLGQENKRFQKPQVDFHLLARSTSHGHL